MRFTGINGDTIRKGIGISIGYGKGAAGNGRYNPNRIQRSGVDDDVIVKRRGIDQIIGSRSAAQVLYCNGIGYIIRTIRLAGAYYRPCLVVGDERQVSADLVFLIRVAVIVRIQRSAIVQALAWYGSVSRGRAGRGRRRTAGRVDVVAAVRRSSRQVQAYIVGQLVGLGSARRDADVIGQRVRVTIDKGQGPASYRRHDISRRIISRNDRNIVVKVRRIHQVISAWRPSEVHHLDRIHYCVRAIGIRPRYHHCIFTMRDIGEVAAYLVFFFRYGVVVGIKDRPIVQTFTWLWVARRTVSTGGVHIVTTIRRYRRQIQRHIVD